MVADLVLIALGIALQPFRLSAFILILNTEGGTKKGLGFILGWLACLVLVIAVVVLITGGKPARLRTVHKAVRRSAARTNPGTRPTLSIGHGPVARPGIQYVMPGNCSRACSSWSAHSRGQPKARAAWPLMSAAAAPLVKWTYSPQFIRRV